MRRTDVIVLVAVVVFGVVLAILILPLFGEARVYPPQSVNNTQLRGIHQGMVVYAQDNKGFYPGVDTAGAVVDSTLSGQLAMLLDAGHIPRNYLINPTDSHLNEVIDYGSGYVVSVFNHSYAGLDLTSPGGRVNAWSETLGIEEIVLSDRNTGVDANAGIQSVWSEPGTWKGTVIRNDGSSAHEISHLIDTAYTEPSTSVAADAPVVTRHEFPDDNLFEAVGPHDAWLVHD